MNASLMSIELQWNKKYKFISDGTWFVSSTEVKLICWYLNEPNINMPVELLNKLLEGMEK